MPVALPVTAGAVDAVQFAVGAVRFGPFEPAHVVGTGGALGALARYAVSEAVDVDEFPLGTFVVNVLGSFVLGLVAFAGVGGEAALLVGTGACGSFTTFSSFSFETVRLWETGERGRATANAAGNLLGAGVALALAWVLVQLFVA